MANLYCRSCGRLLDVIFSEEHRAFMADRKFEVGMIFVDEKGKLWRVTDVEKYSWAGWKHYVTRYYEEY